MVEMKCQVIRDTRKNYPVFKSCPRGCPHSKYRGTIISWFCLISCSLTPPFFFFLMLFFSVHPNVSQGCQGGCATCSDYNGCLSCKPRLFFVLERIGMKQIGVCLSSCPSGYYGTRYPDINKCASKCWGKWMDLFFLSWILSPLRSQVNRKADGTGCVFICSVLL